MHFSRTFRVSAAAAAAAKSLSHVRLCATRRRQPTRLLHLTDLKKKVQQQLYNQGPRQAPEQEIEDLAS